MVKLLGRGRGDLEGRFGHGELKMLGSTLKHCVFLHVALRNGYCAGYSLFALPDPLSTFLFLALCSWESDS